MSPARRVVCGTLALLISGLPCWLWLGRWQPPAHGAIAAASASGIRVAGVTPVVPLAALEVAQPPTMNFAALADQNSRDAGAAGAVQASEAPEASEASEASAAAPPAEPVVNALSPAHETLDETAYLPASQLTEWPRPHPQPSPAGDDERNVLLSTAWGNTRTMVALLMIDEQGEVRQVQLADDSLDRPLRQWLERRVMAMRFLPGRLYGRPVRSRLTLELVVE